MKNKELKPLLTSTFNWLSHWGFPAQTANSHSQTLIDQSLPSPQGPWHTLKLIFSGELKFHWQSDFPHPKNHFLLWRSILSLLRLNLVDQNTDIPTIDAIHAATYSLPQQGEIETDKVTDLILPPKQEQEVAHESMNRTQQLEPAIITIPVSVYMLGKFEMRIQDLACELPASRSLSLLKYLLVHHKQSIPREVLMDVFWPETVPETARNNLNVAMHNLRKALRFAIFMPVIVYENGVYKWDPNVQIWVDVEEFEKCIKSGQRLEARDQLRGAVGQYEAAISLYQGDFLEQNPYEEWTIHDRERLRAAYLDAIERLCQIYFRQENYVACIIVCQRILSYDPCREDAYCLLMRCYSRQGQDHLALRQYQNCIKALRAELDVDPAPETTKLYNRIRRREQV
jgi:DNA-binding SARP family transcriptional activator